MTRPILKSSAKAALKDSSQKVSTASNVEDVACADLANRQQHSSHLASSVLNKSELLALFTLPLPQALSTDFSTADSSVADINLTNAIDDTIELTVAEQRLALYHSQHQRTRLLYQATANSRPTYLIQSLKNQFIEYQQYLLSKQLDKRGLIDIDAIERLWQQLHVVDDIIADIVRHMPAQQPAGWQLTSQDGHNSLSMPTVGKLKHPKPIADLASLNSYVLSHFGVSSFTYDRGYYIGHVVGYLFSCYFCAHLSINYGVTALGEQVVADFDYASLETPYMVRLLQGLDGYCKKRIYQLAVICARLSVYASDKRIERMLIAEVNDFDKKLQQQHLDVLLLQGVMPDSSDSTPLF